MVTGKSQNACLMHADARTLRTLVELRDAGLIAPADVARLAGVAQRYPIAISPELASLIQRGEAQDPIARQFVPDLSELDQLPRERPDPLGEEQLSPVSSVVHRYRDRVLLKLTHVCPVYCRFCFRREVVGPGGPPALSGKALEAALGYIAGDRHIWEVILTGGGPVMLAPRRLADITPRLGAISLRTVLRLHPPEPAAAPAP